MNLDKIILSISKERFEPYLKRSGNIENALLLYQKNIEISQEFYGLLSILEITLRNKIDQSFKAHFKNENWLTEIISNELSFQITENKNRLIKSRKEVTNSRILAELNFGFWTTLFNRKYAKIYWKPLHRIFQNMPKENRKRAEVSSRLNHIRVFRNRVYHYEPIIWDLEVLKQKKKDILEIIYWLDSDTHEWTKTFN